MHLNQLSTLLTAATGGGRGSENHLPTATRTQRWQHLCGHDAKQHLGGVTTTSLHPGCLWPWPAAVGSGRPSRGRTVCDSRPWQARGSVAQEQTHLDHTDRLRVRRPGLPSVRHGPGCRQHWGPLAGHQLWQRSSHVDAACLWLATELRVIQSG